MEEFVVAVVLDTICQVLNAYYATVLVPHAHLLLVVLHVLQVTAY